MPSQVDGPTSGELAYNAEGLSWSPVVVVHERQIATPLENHP